MFLSATFFPLLFSLLFFPNFFFFSNLFSFPPYPPTTPGPLFLSSFNLNSPFRGWAILPEEQRSRCLGAREGGGRRRWPRCHPDSPGGADAAAGQAHSGASTVATATLGLGTSKGGLTSSRKLPHCLSINRVFNKRLRGSPAN